MSLRRWLPAAFALLALACARSADVEGSANQMTPIDSSCSPDEVVLCSCATGATGERRCLADGSGFTACECSAEGDTLPAGWICTPDRYGDGSCDCTCGAEDPECAPGQCGGSTGSGGSGAGGGMGGSGAGGAAASGGMGGSGSGVGGGAGAGAGAPAGWQCDPTWYGDGQFCDCNCGLADPDCSATQCTSGSATGCTHSACSAGGPLANWCSPCALAVCALDSYCCNTAWDDQCVLSASLLCSC